MSLGSSSSAPNPSCCLTDPLEHFPHDNPPLVAPVCWGTTSLSPQFHAEHLFCANPCIRTW